MSTAHWQIRNSTYEKALSALMRWREHLISKTEHALITFRFTRVSARSPQSSGDRLCRNSPGFAVQISTRPAVSGAARSSSEDKDNYRRGKRDQNVGDLLVGQGAGGEVLMCFIGA